MNLREQLKQKLARAAELAKAAGERDLTDDELGEVDTLDTDIKSLREKIAKSDRAAAALKGITDAAGTGDDDDDLDGGDEPETKSGGAHTRPRREAAPPRGRRA